MKELSKIYNAYTLNAGSQIMALATVVYVEGSSYRRIGARMLVMSDGQWIGGVSGGCLEGDALIKAKRAILNNYPSIVTYDTREGDDYQIGVGLGCNGLIKIMFVPLSIGMDHHPVEILGNAITTRDLTYLYHIIKSDDPNLLGKVYDRNSIAKLLEIPSASEEVQKIINKKYSGKSKIEVISTDKLNLELLVELVKPRIKLVVIGHNKDVLGICQSAALLDWDIIVFGRIKKLSREVISMAGQVCEYEDIEDFEFDAYTAIVLMTHDLDRDCKVIEVLNVKNLRYLGIMGPKSRYEKLVSCISKSTKDKLMTIQNSIYAPIGLDIGAILPEEIHMSIISEVITVFAGRSGTFLRDRLGPINE